MVGTSAQRWLDDGLQGHNFRQFVITIVILRWLWFFKLLITSSNEEQLLASCFGAWPRPGIRS
jgi:hypothetical protein